MAITAVLKRGCWEIHRTKWIQMDGCDFQATRQPEGIHSLPILVIFILHPHILVGWKFENSKNHFQKYLCWFLKNSNFHWWCYTQQRVCLPNLGGGGGIGTIGFPVSRDEFNLDEYRGIPWRLRNLKTTCLVRFQYISIVVLLLATIEFPLSFQCYSNFGWFLGPPIPRNNSLFQVFNIFGVFLMFHMFP